jgi:hypothetical protein
MTRSTLLSRRPPRSWRFSLLILALLLAAGCDNEDDDAPAISWLAVRPHEDRGVCTGCHVRLTQGGTRIPQITSAARMPHDERGVCSNCHTIALGGAGLRIGQQVNAVVPQTGAFSPQAGIVPPPLSGTGAAAQPGSQGPVSF